MFVLTATPLTLHTILHHPRILFLSSSSSRPSAAQNVNASPRPTPQDLAGFWDLLQLSIEDISLKFDELYHLKSNEWQPALSAAAAQSPPDRKVLPTPAAQCPGWGRKAAETGLSPPTTTAIPPLPLSSSFCVPVYLDPPTEKYPPPRPLERGPRSPFQTCMVHFISKRAVRSSSVKSPALSMHATAGVHVVEAHGKSRSSGAVRPCLSLVTCACLCRQSSCGQLVNPKYH